MGTCGCVETPPTWTLPAPGGGLYGVHLYEPCRYCETPGGVVISRVDQEDAARYSYDLAPTLPICLGGVGLAVLDVQRLRELIHTSCAGISATIEGDDEVLTQKELAEVLCEELWILVGDMVAATFRETEANVSNMPDQQKTEKAWDEGVVWHDPITITWADRGDQERAFLTSPFAVPEGYEAVVGLAPEGGLDSWLVLRHPTPFGELEALVGEWGEEEDVWHLRRGSAPVGWVDSLGEHGGW